MTHQYDVCLLVSVDGNLDVLNVYSLEPTTRWDCKPKFSLHFEVKLTQFLGNRVHSVPQNKQVSLFCCETQSQLYRLCVQIRKKLFLYEYVGTFKLLKVISHIFSVSESICIDKKQNLQEINLPEPALVIEWYKGVLCVGYKKEYELVRELIAVTINDRQLATIHWLDNVHSLLTTIDWCGNARNNAFISSWQRINRTFHQTSINWDSSCEGWWVLWGNEKSIHLAKNLCSALLSLYWLTDILWLCRAWCVHHRTRTSDAWEHSLDKASSTFRYSVARILVTRNRNCWSKFSFMWLLCVCARRFSWSLRISSRACDSLSRSAQHSQPATRAEYSLASEQKSETDIRLWRHQVYAQWVDVFGSIYNAKSIISMSFIDLIYCSLVATRTVVFCVQSMPVDKQIERMLANLRVKDAVAMVEYLGASLEPEIARQVLSCFWLVDWWVFVCWSCFYLVQQLLSVHLQAGLVLFRQLQFEEAFKHFTDASADPRQILDFFPGSFVKTAWWSLSWMTFSSCAFVCFVISVH